MFSTTQLGGMTTQVFRYSHSAKAVVIYSYVPLDPRSWDLGEGSKMFKDCSYTNCYLTANKKFLPEIHKFSALLFHSWKLFSKVLGMEEILGSI